MQNNESGSVKNRVNALSDAKRLLLESLLEEQRKRKTDHPARQRAA